MGARENVEKIWDNPRDSLSYKNSDNLQETVVV